MIDDILNGYGILKSSQSTGAYSIQIHWKKEMSFLFFIQIILLFFLKLVDNVIFRDYFFSSS